MEITNTGQLPDAPGKILEEAVILLADISGFTALGEKLNEEHGPAQGAEEFAKQMAEAKAAAEAIRRAEAEAAAKQEKERQAREMARVGEGLNEECPYITLEATAIKGELTTDNINCLESSIHKAELGIDRANVSMVLLTNARAKGDIEDWEKRMEYHLLNIERDNPALAYRYALHLFEKGPGESQATYRWTGIALQSRSAWAGEAYTERVNAIYKLRAAAAQSPACGPHLARLLYFY